jgi:hypothetical protein
VGDADYPSSSKKPTEYNGTPQRKQTRQLIASAQFYFQDGQHVDTDDFDNVTKQVSNHTGFMQNKKYTSDIQKHDSSNLNC